jgi:hypothetical protein
MTDDTFFDEDSFEGEAREEPEAGAAEAEARREPAAGLTWDVADFLRSLCSNSRALSFST